MISSNQIECVQTKVEAQDNTLGIAMLRMIMKQKEEVRDDEQKMNEKGNHHDSGIDTQRMNLLHSIDSKRVNRKKRKIYGLSDTEDGSYVDSMDDEDDSSCDYEIDIDECLERQKIKKRRIESANRRSLSTLASTCTAVLDEDHNFACPYADPYFNNNHKDVKTTKKRKIISDIPWSLEEDLVLLEKQKIIGNDWAGIASFLPERSRIDVKVRFISITRAGNKLWTSEEDDKLLKLYHEHNGYWVKVSSSFPSRTRNGLKTRFKELRDPQSYPIPVPSYGSPLQVFYYRNHSHFLQNKRDPITTLEKDGGNVIQAKKSTNNRLDVLNACILSKSLIENKENATEAKAKHQDSVPLSISDDIDKHQHNSICFLADAALLHCQNNLGSRFSGSIADDLASKQMTSTSLIFQTFPNMHSPIQFSPTMLFPARSFSSLQPFASMNQIALNATHFFKVSSGSVKCPPYWNNEGC